MSNSALASLTATYTDSENEEDRGGISSESDSENSQASRVIIPITPVSTPVKAKKSKKSLRLVSYHDDSYVSDNDEEESEEDEEEVENERMEIPVEINSFEQMSNPIAETNLEKYAHYGFSLPPEPKGKPPQELIDKINNLYSKMETNNMDMNKIIQGRKEFRNPSIYEKLIQFCDINEFGTNYPPEIYDPLQWGPESFYEELTKAQKIEMDKKKKEKKDNDKIEQATAAARKVEEEAKKRKSKWDQPAPIKTNVGAPALTTTVTGTKGTVISAFGSLPKKTIV